MWVGPGLVLEAEGCEKAADQPPGPVEGGEGWPVGPLQKPYVSPSSCPTQLFTGILGL